MSLVNPPTFITYAGMNFLIMDAPSDSNLKLYLKLISFKMVDETQQLRKNEFFIQLDVIYFGRSLIFLQIKVDAREFEKYNVTDLVRLCEPTYSIQPILDKGIKMHDISFQDGEPPPKSVVDTWIKLYESVFANNKQSPTIAVHCVAGLGRAPVLVAIALMEKGMDPLDAIELLRKKRKGVINNRQFKYIESYPQRKGNCSIQ